MASAILRPTEYTTSPACRTLRTLAITLALKPPHSDELDATATMAVGREADEFSGTSAIFLVTENSPLSAEGRDARSGPGMTEPLTTVSIR